MFRRRPYKLLRAQAIPDDEVSIQIKLRILLVIAPFILLLQFLYMHSTDTLAVVADSETPNITSPTQGFVITMHNEIGHRVAEQLKLAFGIKDMHVVMGHVGNYSTLSLYNRHLMRHGRTDGLQIGNTRMLGCLETHRQIWTRIHENSYIFEDDAVARKDSLKITKMLLNDSADRHWSVIQLDIPGGFVSGRLFHPDRSQFKNIGKITETCRDCITWSTKAYIITKEAAQILLQNYEPPVVQVDAYMSLLHAYHPHFTKVWSRVQAVDVRMHLSGVQDYFETIQFWWTISNLFTPQH
jgi:hypothetical protein